jgi:CRISPR-associated protein Cas5/CasD subtype I-E
MVSSPHVRGGLSAQKLAMLPPFAPRMWGFIADSESLLGIGTRSAPRISGGLSHSPFTMKKITIHLAAPLASFGVGMRLQHRQTAPVATRSAIIGMIACAMGRVRGSDNSDIEQLTIEWGEQQHDGIARDFQTVREGVTYGGSPNRAIITERHFMQDYSGSATLSGDDALIDSVERSLRLPTWQLYLGRRAHVLSAPVVQSAAVAVP